MKKRKFTGFSNLKTPKLKKLPDGPIFYHHDECDCIECRARTEKGGLDYDPTNDNEEFEEHERQAFRDAEIISEEILIKKTRKKGCKMNIGQRIKFSAISALTGQTLKLEGTVEGGAKEIKKFQPEEFGGLKDDEEVYLVKREDGFGNTLRYVVYPEEVLEKEE